MADANILLLGRESRIQMFARLPQGRLRILYHHRTQGRGAEGNHIVAVVTALRELGHSVTVLSPPGVDPFAKDSTPVDKSNVKVTGIRRVWRIVSRAFPHWVFELAEIAYNIPAYFRLSKVLGKTPCDLVYERYAFFLLAGAFAADRCGVPLLLEINEVSGVPERARKQVFTRLCGLFERILFRRCSRLHAVSSYLGGRAMESGAAPNKVVVVSNGFDLSRVPPTTKREVFRQQFGLENCFVIGFAGWFDQWDRLPMLVDVLSDLLERDPNFRLCLIGDGVGKHAAAQRASDLGILDKVVFTGPVPKTEIFHYISMLDVGVLAHSNVFGSPMIMFEMMGLGIPLVLPRLPPIEDVHRHGETALLFHPFHTKECAEHISTLWADQAGRMRIASNARSKLLTEHSWTATVRRILKA